MATINKIGTSARDAAIAGMSYVAKTVKDTIGPFGMNVLLSKGNSITNDGFLISTQLVPSIKDEFERQGARIALEASSKTNDMVGDATSTAWALTDAIVKECIRYLPSDKVIKAQKTPSAIQKEINEAKATVLAELASNSTPVASSDELVKSALVAVEDETLAKLLGETQWDLGSEGIILAEEVNEITSSIEKVKGIRIDNGFGTSMVITNPEKQSLELNEISVMLTNYTIDIPQLQLLKDSIFTPLIQQKKLAIVLVARAFTSEAIKTCMESLKTGFAIFPINAPYVYQSQIMKDIESVIGGRHIDIEESRLEDIDVKDIGFAKRFVARQFDGVVTGEDTPEAQLRVDKRVEELKKKLISANDFEKKMIETRIAQLTNGFAILKIGSQSLTNRKRLHDKADDATQAVRWALKFGTVRGGGQALKEAGDKLEEGNILKRPLNVIYDTIMASAPEGFVIPDFVRDPLYVIQTALSNACETSAVFCSVNGIVTEANKKECNCGKNEE